MLIYFEKSNLTDYLTLRMVLPKFYIYHPQAMQDVDDFVSSSEQIWRNVALHHLLTIGSSAVNGCRQNESKQLIKTST